MSYFSNKNYTAIYLHSAGDKFASALIDVFTGALFYSLGMPLHFIVLFYALEFGFRGVLSPLGAVLVSRFGIPSTVTAAYVSLSLFFITIAQAETSLIIGFFAFVFHSLARGIYYPCLHTIRALYIADGTRGSQMSFEIILGSTVSILALGIGSLVLARHSYYYIAIIAILILLLSLIPYWIMLGKVPFEKNVRFSDPYRFLVSEGYRENILPFFGHALVIIGFYMLVPLFIFIVVGDFEVFGLILILVVIIETIFTLAFGKRVDANGHTTSVKEALRLHGLAPVGFILLGKTALGAFLLQAYSKITYNMFDSSYTTRIHRKMKKSTMPLVFGSAKEMTLCFSELVVLSFFALLAYFIGVAFFIVAFAAWLAGLYIAAHYFRD